MAGDHPRDHGFAALRDICGEVLQPRLSRRGLFGAAGALAATGFAGDLMPEAVAQTPTALPVRGEFVIRNAYILSVDPTIGDMPRGDIHVRGGDIAAVGPTLAVPPGTMEIDAARMIAMPGFVETHWHCWNSLQRNWLTPEAGYMATKNATAKFYAPADFYNSDRLAFAEAINAGITTTYNYAHNVISAEHAAAEMKAHTDSGIRGIYGYGCADLLPAAQAMDITGLRQAHKLWEAGATRDKEQLRLGVSLRGPRSTTPEVFDAEMKAAKELGLPIIFHAGQSPSSTVSTEALKAKGYLTPDLTLVHYVLATQADRDNLAAAGMSLSYTVHGELRVRARDPAEQFLHMVASGVNVCLSFDGNSISPVDMFSSMCLAWDMGAPKDGTSTEKLTAVDFRQVLNMATINGAKAMGYDKLIGTLTPGKRADIILVRADDLNMAPFGNVDCALVRSANAANVDTVIADGRIMKRGGKLVGIDPQGVIRAAAASAHAIRKRAGGRLIPQENEPRGY
ncbi:MULTISPECIES: amidohydrolase family protein [unclassified Beijerinckia]|uniref:amidohydrolase family protein n=1 Tax=unclassified Beijerinckia TaxID=2638183 RepID=UPI000894E96D|nr:MULTISPECIES: amidohydrolase family protein [unclassified Beijerinckia]MDH7796576.1 5-methylthioadenosine/S-adenosylhomocysteine deaminase [Beijerinckia sp. GAS462]SEC51005.1 Cytosine/adenosine deaminase [Beijerinckia sp. 28-YEA-48]